jgi:hypothetical protein
MTGQLVAVFFDQAGDLEQILFAVLGFAVAPFLKRRVSRFGRAIDVFGMPAPGASEHAVGGRIQRFESFAARALGPLAVDVMLRQWSWRAWLGSGRSIPG